ncbi:MAG TPA: nitrate reductase molybdenum cofactor assembly chaperone [Dehalococcoidia bacterium]|nr:nitrate reductase molybdenum cofactor assembly chaperone [Dehalococcoidia bacterium]
MYSKAETGLVLRLFADILDYPVEALADRTRECEAALLNRAPEAVSPLGEFRSFVEGALQGRLEEVYTGVFDLNPVCHPYVGYQLFGESYKRSAFLLGLKERYGAQGFQAPDSELPDRFSVMLRFLAQSNDEALNQEMIADGLVPALERIGKEWGKAETSSEVEDSQSNIQLEGQSQGEVLRGGFLLEMIEGGDPERASAAAYPYQQALHALRLFLGSLEPAEVNRQESRPGGGANA